MFNTKGTYKIIESQTITVFHEKSGLNKYSEFLVKKYINIYYVYRVEFNPMHRPEYDPTRS